MGRYSYPSRLAVESCKALTVKFLNEMRYFDGGRHYGGVNWRLGEEITGSICVLVTTVNDEGYIRFTYTYTDLNSGEKENLDYGARLVSTPCNYGGRRWWFICPLIKDGQPCNRRVGVLYLGDGKYFGCRHCYNLTYQSSKESHRFERMFRKMGFDPKFAKELFED